MYVLYNYGGVYVDTDVDFIKPIEDTLCHRFACGIQVPIIESAESIYNRKSLQTGFLYSDKAHPFLRVAIHELYDNGKRHFVKADGSLDMMPIDVKLMDVLISFLGANPIDKDQILKDDIMLYNSSLYATRKSKSKDSYIIHWLDQSWSDAHGAIPKIKKFIKKYLYFIYSKQ